MFVNVLYVIKLSSNVCIFVQLHQFVQNNFTSARMALVGLGKSLYTSNIAVPLL